MLKNTLINLVLVLLVLTVAYGAVYFFFIYAVKFKNNEKVAVLERLPQTKWVAEIELCLSAYRPGPVEVLPRLIKFDIKGTSSASLARCLRQYPRAKREQIKKLLKKYDTDTVR